MKSGMWRKRTASLSHSLFPSPHLPYTLGICFFIKNIFLVLVYPVITLYYLKSTLLSRIIVLRVQIIFPMNCNVMIREKLNFTLTKVKLEKVKEMLKHSFNLMSPRVFDKSISTQQNMWSIITPARYFSVTNLFSDFNKLNI